jgi:hypothetical protein
VLPPPVPLPVEIYNLLTGSNHLSKDLKNNLRAYNSAFAFSSFNAQLDENLNSLLRGVYTFRIFGGIYHAIGSLTHTNLQKPKFAQIYFYDKDAQTHRRKEIFSNLNVDIINKLYDILTVSNPYITQFKTASQRLLTEQYSDLDIQINPGQDKDLRRFNEPSVSEVAVIIPGSGSFGEPSKRNVVAFSTDGSLKRISELSPIYDPLIGYVGVVEFQKRCLPHAHVLLILHPDDKLKDTDDYDRIVSAELPDPNLNPAAYETVSKLMIQNCCGQHNLTAPCIK